MNPIFVAIDTPSLERAKLLAEQVRANAGGVKLGLEFFSANGPAGVTAILATRNWHDVTLNLWGDIQADIKVPFLVGLAFLLGWLPTYLIYRARLWRQRQRLDNFERQQAAPRAEMTVQDVPTA